MLNLGFNMRMILAALSSPFLLLITQVNAEKNQITTYTEAEKKIYKISATYKSSERLIFEKLSNLRGVKSTPYYFFQMCRALSNNNVKEISSLLLELQQSKNISENNKSAAKLFCEQYADILEGDGADLETAAQYKNLDKIESAPMKVLVSHDYAYMMLEKGFCDEALQAINQSLNIALYNHDFLELPNIYGTLALIKSELNLVDEALADNKLALSFMHSNQARAPFLLERGYILLESKRFDEAEEIYTQILKDVEGVDLYQTFIVKANLARVYLINKRVEELKTITDEVMEISKKLGDEENLAFARVYRAFYLLTIDEFESAKKMFYKANEWFSGHFYNSASKNLEMWSYLLEEKGLISEALGALKESIHLKNSIDESRRQEGALFLNKVLQKERQDARLKETEAQMKLQSAMLESKKVKQYQAYLFILFLLVLAGVISVYLLRTKNLNKKLTQVNSKLDYECKHDPLTNTCNRRFFYEYIDKKTVKQSLSDYTFVALIDIDYFKLVNDSYGHDAGDKVLIEIASRLNKATRNKDTVVRWGGEEFLIFLEPFNNENDTKLFIQRLLNTIEEQGINIGNSTLNISVSVGFGLLKTALMLDEIKFIDDFLYQAKESGRKKAIGVCSYDFKATPLTITSEDELKNNEFAYDKELH